MKYQKGEVDFYKMHTPFELIKMGKLFPNVKDRIKYFRDNYIYHGREKVWYTADTYNQIFKRGR